VLRGGRDFGRGAFFQAKKMCLMRREIRRIKYILVFQKSKLRYTKILGAAALQDSAFSGFNTDTSKELSTSIFMVAQVTHLLCLIFNFLKSNVLSEIRALSYRRFGTCIEMSVRNYH